MRASMSSGLPDLANDMAKSRRKLPAEARKVVDSGARAGNMLAKESARERAGKPGKHYHRAFTWEPRPTFVGFGTATYSAEYGPDVARRQGGMATGFEDAVGRQTVPHHNLLRSQDVIGPSFGQEVQQMMGRILW